MTETLTIINTITLLAMLIVYLLASKRYGANAFMHPRAGDKLSMLNRRRKALHLATKKWHSNVNGGYTISASDSKRLVDQLEREVAALENELFGPKEEATPKPKTPKSGPVVSTKIDSAGVFGFFYTSDCSLCGWSFSSYSKETAEEKGTEHERTHA